MDQEHPGEETLALYARGELEREASRDLERHLVGCLFCQSAVDRLPAGSGSVVRWQAHRFARPQQPRRPGPEQRENLRGVLRALGNAIAATSEKEAAHLLSQPELRRRALIREDDRLHTVDLCELLEARCRAAWLDDPGEAVELAKLAALIAQRLDPELYGSRRVEDVRAVAWVHLGTSFRLAALEEPPGWSEVAERGDSADAEAYPAAAVGPALVRDDGGQFAAVSAALREVRESFLDRAMGYDAALATLDLVSAHLREGRSEQIAGLAREAASLFEKHGAEAYLLDAMRFLLDSAAGGEGVTPELIGRMARLLQRKRSGIEERFGGER